MNKIVTTSIILFFSITTLISAQSSRPMVSGIGAKAESTTQITIFWELPSVSITELAIYRDSSPISSRTALEGMTPIARINGNKTSYTDTVLDYREYYYAVISLTGYSVYDIALPSVNATVTGIRVLNKIASASDSEINDIERPTSTGTFYGQEEKPLAEGSIRELPLPYLNVLPGQDKSSGTIGDASLDAALSLTDSTIKQKKLQPYIFSQEDSVEQSGDDYLLYNIISNDFKSGQYEAAANSLINFLQIRRGDDITNRAVFYLGESYYYLGKYRESLNQFLLLPESLDNLSKRWIQAVLEAM